VAPQFHEVWGPEFRVKRHGTFQKRSRVFGISSKLERLKPCHLDEKTFPRALGLFVYNLVLAESIMRLMRKCETELGATSG
jgi:hypothetical protein